MRSLLVVLVLTLVACRGDQPLPPPKPTLVEAVASLIKAQDAAFAQTDEVIAILSAALYECREGRSWPGMKEWRKEHPGCGRDCVDALLAEQRVRASR